MNTPRNNRRDFLFGRAAVSAAANALESLLDPAIDDAPPSKPPSVGWRILQLTRRAMACEFELRVCERSNGNSTSAGMQALDEIERVEDELTIYREQSDLIDLNFQAAEGPAKADQEMFDLLCVCDRIYRETKGAFDPTSGPLSRVWGFHRREGRMPSDAERDEALKSVGWKGVTLNASERSVQFTMAPREINANSIGKGYALDRAGRILDREGLADTLMHGGRSTLFARGDNHQLAGGGWRVGVRNPLTPERYAARFTLRDEALSTSGSATQFFEHEGKRYGHLIDPRTGWPAEGIFTATVIAPTAAEADAYSTAAYILGVEGTAELCSRLPQVKALLLAATPEGELAIHAFNLDDRPWKAEAAPA